jgi:hypothetical protein
VKDRDGRSLVFLGDLRAPSHVDVLVSDGKYWSVDDQFILILVVLVPFMVSVVVVVVVIVLILLWVEGSLLEAI